MKFVRADLGKQPRLVWEALHCTRNVTFAGSTSSSSSNEGSTYEDVELQPLIAKWAVQSPAAAIQKACAKENSELNMVGDLEYLLSFEDLTMPENQLIVTTVNAIKLGRDGYADPNKMRNIFGMHFDLQSEIWRRSDGADRETLKFESGADAILSLLRDA